MPILDVEPAVFPANLLENDYCVVEDRRWFVLHTKSRHEKMLGRTLHEREVPFYLPLVKRRLRIRGRVVHSHVPLFNCYVFLLGNRDERLTALSTGRVVRALEVAEQERLWSDLRQVHRLLAIGAPVTPEERMIPGTRVEIRSGALAGLCGVIVRSSSGRRFVVQVDFIQRGASVLLDDFCLTPMH